jgi:ACR3 family arsenite efflux pump ArsB
MRNSKRIKWFNKYYIIIIILCIMAGLFIWFSFRVILSELEQKKDEAYKKKTTSISKKKSGLWLLSSKNKINDQNN